MSKGTLSFDLTNPVEAEQFRRAIIADKLYLILQHIDAQIIKELSEVAPKHPVVEKYNQIMGDKWDVLQDN